MTVLEERASMQHMLEIIVGLAILIFALLFPSATAFIILGVAVFLAVPQVIKNRRK